MGNAAQAETVRVVLLSPAIQTARPGQLVPTPFRFRVERLNGEPVPGVRVWYGTALGGPNCFPPPDPWCLSATEIGSFEPGHPDDPLSVLVTTGGDGTATTPPYRVGIPLLLPRGFVLGAVVEPQTTPSGLVVDLATGALSIVEFAAGVVAVPALGVAASATLVLLLAAAGLWTMRRARAS